MSIWPYQVRHSGPTEGAGNLELSQYEWFLHGLQAEPNRSIRKRHSSMNATTYSNDISAVVAADRAHVWHHLVNHKPFESVDPRIIVEGRGMRVWDATGKEHIDAVSGGVWTVNVGYGRESIANAVRDQLVKMNFFGGSVGSVPGAQFAERLI
jgi:4-aminobutyrate aminotransferase-like enzyme